MGIELPTIFRGCFWDAHWEFDAPCVIYFPVCRYGFGGNSYTFDRLVENVCIDLAIQGEVHSGWSSSELNEFDWRGWSHADFPKLPEAWHLKTHVRWFEYDDQVRFEMFDRKEQWGPFND